VVEAAATAAAAAAVALLHLVLVQPCSLQLA